VPTRIRRDERRDLGQFAFGKQEFEFRLRSRWHDKHPRLLLLLPEHKLARILPPVTALPLNLRGRR
jgi:hypothetical protein